jgi:hypothetical protein
MKGAGLRIVSVTGAATILMIVMEVALKMTDPEKLASVIHL